MEMRANYVYYIGAGAVTAAGIISLAAVDADDLARARRRPRRLPRTIASSGKARPRTERDLPMTFVLVRRAGCARSRWSCCRRSGSTSLAAVLAVFFAFLFVTVSSRITGQIGASANPISGMTVATVLLTALIFLAFGWTATEHRVLALSIGGVVCVAAAVAGATSQDLKTGYIVGATPARQQIGLLFGVTTLGAAHRRDDPLLDTRTRRSSRRATPASCVSTIDRGRDGDREQACAYQVGHLVRRRRAARRRANISWTRSTRSSISSIPASAAAIRRT